MHRREVLRLLATGSLLQLAPAKLLAVLRETRGLLESQTSPRTLNAHQYATAKAMAELILPRTDTPGATEIGVVDFIDLILTEWYDQADRARFLAGLTDLDSRTHARFGSDFLDCSSTQQADTLTELGEKMRDETKGSGPRLPGRRAARPTSFYAMFRHLTLTAYYTSEAGSTEELHFEMIPGQYQGCAAEPTNDAPEPK